MPQRRHPRKEHPINIPSIRTTRFLTHEEAAVIEQAAETWLRLLEVQFNAGAEAAALLARAELRKPGCARRDIATLDRTILLQVPGHPAPVPLTLVRPADEDLWAGRVSLTGELGLACIGQVLGSHMVLPQGVARFVGFAGDSLREIPALEEEGAPA